MTLIELLITLSIALVLMSIAIPSLQSALATNRVAGLTNELAAALTFARSEAVTRATTVTVCKSADTETLIDNDADPSTGPTCLAADDTNLGWQSGWLVFVDVDEDGTVDAGDTRLRVGQPAAINTRIDGGGSATDATDGNFDRYLSYRPSGVSQGSGAAQHDDDGDGVADWEGLSICSAPNQRNIVLNETGRIRIETPQVPCT